VRDIPNLKKSPRLQFLDTGLINYFVGLQEYFYKTQDLHSFYQGILAEHIVVPAVKMIKYEQPVLKYLRSIDLSFSLRP